MVCTASSSGLLPSGRSQQHKRPCTHRCSAPSLAVHQRAMAANVRESEGSAVGPLGACAKPSGASAGGTTFDRATLPPSARAHDRCHAKVLYRACCRPSEMHCHIHSETMQASPMTGRASNGRPASLGLWRSAIIWAGATGTQATRPYRACFRLMLTANRPAMSAMALLRMRNATQVQKQGRGNPCLRPRGMAPARPGCQDQVRHQRSHIANVHSLQLTFPQYAAPMMPGQNWLPTRSLPPAACRWRWWLQT